MHTHTHTHTNTNGRPHTSLLVQAGVFSYARRITEAQAGERVVDTVVAVPAWLGVAQRQALIDAASLAGLNVLGLVSSHAAAALQYGIERDFSKGEQTVRAVKQTGAGGPGVGGVRGGSCA